MKLVGSRTGEIKVGNAEAAVEYINGRPNENFTIYDVTKDVINEIKKKVNNIITKG